MGPTPGSRSGGSRLAAKYSTSLGWLRHRRGRSSYGLAASAMATVPERVTKDLDLVHFGGSLSDTRMGLMEYGREIGQTTAEPDVDWSDLGEEEAKLRDIREFLARGERLRRRRRVLGTGLVAGVAILVGITIVVRLTQHQAPAPAAETDTTTSRVGAPADITPAEPPAVERRVTAFAEMSTPDPRPVSPREPASTSRESVAPDQDALARREPSSADRGTAARREPSRPARDVPVRSRPSPSRPEPPAVAKPSAPAVSTPVASSRPGPARETSRTLAAAVPPTGSSARPAELPPRTAPPVQGPALTPPVPARAPTPMLASVSYHPHGRLASVQVGDTKDRVFGLLATSFERQNGSLMRIEGIRLRAGARSPRYGHVEIAEARIGETSAAVPYWFLFGDEKLLAWGRSDEWAATAARYQIESSYMADGPRADPTRPTR